MTEMSGYIELHAASAFSFLEGASLPEDLIDAAAEKNLSAIALVDRDGVYGAPRFYKAAKEKNIRALVGAEVTVRADQLNLSSKTTARLTLLVENQKGYKNLCRLITAGALGSPKGKTAVTWEQIALYSQGLHCLTGGDEGLFHKVLSEQDSSKGQNALSQITDRLKNIFGDRFHVELQRHDRRDQEQRNYKLIELARQFSLPLVATNGTRYARARDKELFDVMTCIRNGLPLDQARSLLDANRERYVKSPAEMRAQFVDTPQAVQNAFHLGQQLNFTLADLGYQFPDYPLPKDHTPISYLRQLTWECAPQRFKPVTEVVKRQLEKELNVIEKLDLAGYFLIVRDIIEFCHENHILVQGRGSAANSAVCYALSITAVDPVNMELLFERFLSEERGEWPDIDLDLPSGDQRERVIQHLYDKYGQHGAAMTANVITYRGKSAIRDVGKAFGYSLEQVNTLSTYLGTLEATDLRANPQIIAARLFEAGFNPADDRVQMMVRQWLRIRGLPRHLGQHSGGMVIARGRLDEIVPLEQASMPGRVVIQWDKEDCTDLGLIKIDLLGLGMLAAIEDALLRILKHEGIKVDLAHLPQDDARVFKMFREADTVGVFQIESRAQMSSLPRTAPKRFYDLVTQVAIIRPGPIMGGMVHPFFDRRQGKSAVEFLHPCLEPILKRTLGVPIFQEQVIKMAMASAGLSGGEAEELRRAMGFKRSIDRMESIERKLRVGMDKNGIVGEVQDKIVQQITAFALYGFPESHAASFALIAYASGYLKAYHPAAFYASLLNAWPMGFYSPATLIKDAQRHQVIVHPVDVAKSDWFCDIENSLSQQGFRVGLRYVKGMTYALGQKIMCERQKRPFASIQDLARRCHARADELTNLAFSGAFASFGLRRRESLWQVAQVNRSPGPIFDKVSDESSSPLSEMTDQQETNADYSTTSLTVGQHFMGYQRSKLAKQGVIATKDLMNHREGEYIRVAGAVIVRQRPGTAKGFVFLTLEDEFGMVQAILNPNLFDLRRAVIVGSSALIVEGRLQKNHEQMSVRAQKIFPLSETPPVISHDFS